MFTNVRYILLTALRDWLFAALMIGVIACTMIAHMLGSTALIEMQEMTLSYASASARVIIITGLIIFTCFHVRNAFDTKEIDVFLSRPITRSSLVFSYWVGFAAVVVFLLIPTVGLILVQGVLNWKGFFFWALSLLIECWLIVAAALFCAFTIKSAVASTMAAMGFYTLARMMGFFITATQTGVTSEKGFFVYPLKIISFIIPRLDSLVKSDWLIYGVRNYGELKLFALQAVIFIPLFIFATIIDFQRKQF